MADELIDLLDENGKPTGKTAMKHEAHRNGWWHRIATVWIYSPSGHILFQRRMHNRDLVPNTLAASAAGHVAAGESFRQAAVREISEEIGVSVLEEQLEELCVVKRSTPVPGWPAPHNEFVTVFLCHMNRDGFEHALTDGEVHSIEWRSIDEIEGQLRDKPEQFAVPQHLRQVVDAVRERLSKK